ncbi:hypothetical protein DL770_003329 [Monosporascus sp. CRB-9-2]|nr:hypothetical protein DL770_003329 [Monosporascus sp. CRB-9-2]
MDQADIPALLSRLSSDEDAVRKMAVFKLQSSINDPSFADVFISSGGLIILRRLIMSAGGNTLAYSLQSLSRLLEVDMGWDIFEGPTAADLVERIVELIVTNPLVNILRGAMSILVALVSHSQSTTRSPPRTPGAFGFRALKPAVAVYPQFFDLVIQQLESADHALCANALMLINALIRDAVSGETAMENNAKASGTGEEWSKFIKRLQDLGLIKAVYNLMQSSALQDLAHPLLEFQSLTKVLLQKWRQVRVDLERPEHRRALKGIHLASAPTKDYANGYGNGGRVEELQESGKKSSRKHNPEKWRRLGFETESPASEFDQAGFLGMMDLTDFVRKNEDAFQKLLLEQSTKPMQERCPIARASLAITLILYDHFECDKTGMEDLRGRQPSDGKQTDKLFRPLLLQWSRLHTAGLYAFFRLWRATGAEQWDFDKVADLVRILVDQVIGQAGRAKDVVEVEEDLLEYDCGRLRELQMELLELSFEDRWGHHLYQVRNDLNQESLAFVKEQRIRCLLQGSWFSKPAPRRDSRGESYPSRRAADDSLGEKVDLGTISSVVSNVMAPNEDAKSEASTSTPKLSSVPPPSRHTTKITIYRYVNPQEARKGGNGEEEPLLTLYPMNHILASEWLDGLLMLLEQAPITAETHKLIKLVGDYGFKIRRLNFRTDAAYAGPPKGAGMVPSREGLDDDFCSHPRPFGKAHSPQANGARSPLTLSHLVSLITKFHQSDFNLFPMVMAPSAGGGTSDAPPSTPPPPSRPDGLFRNGVWYCNCPPRLPAVQFTVRRETKNKGRSFYGCPKKRSEGNQCDLFLWAEDARSREVDTLLMGKNPETPGSSRKKLRQTTLHMSITPRADRSRRLDERTPVTEVPDLNHVARGDGSAAAPVPAPASAETATLRATSGSSSAPPPVAADDLDLSSDLSTDLSTDAEGELARMADAASPSSSPNTGAKRKRPDDDDEYSDFSSGEEEQLLTITDRSSGLGGGKKRDAFATPSVAAGRIHNVETASSMPTPLTDKPLRRILFADPKVGSPPPTTHRDNNNKRQRTVDEARDRASPPGATGESTHDDVTHEVMSLLQTREGVDEAVLRDVRAALERHAARARGLERGRDAARRAARDTEARVAELERRVADLEDRRAADADARRRLRSGILEL